MRGWVPRADLLAERLGRAYDRLLDGLVSVTAGIGKRSEDVTEGASGWLGRLLLRVDRDPRVALAGGLVGGWLILAPITGHHGMTLSLPAAGLIVLAVVAPTAGLTGIVAIVAFRPPDVLADVLAGVGYAPTLAFAILLGCLIRLLLERPTLRARLVPLAITFYGAASLYAYLRVGGTMDPAQELFCNSRIVLIGAGLALLLSAIYLGTRMGRSVLYGTVLVAGSVVAVMGLITWAPELLTTFGSTDFLRTTDYTGRAFGPFFGPNYFGVCEAMIFVFIVAWPAGPSSRWWMIARLVAGICAGTAVTLSMARGAVLAAEVGLVMLAFQRGRRAGLVGLVAAIGFLLVIYPRFVDWRLGITFGSDLIRAHQALDESTGWRLDTLVAGLNLFRDNPIFGVGFGQFHFLSPRYLGPDVGITYSHDWYVNVLAEQGLIGFSAFMLMLLGIGWTLLRSAAVGAAGMLAVFSVFLFSCLSAEPVSDLQTTGIFWVILGLGLATAPAAGNRGRSPVESPPLDAERLERWRRLEPRCLSCGDLLHLDARQFECPRGDATYPVICGIPRFVESEDYAASFGFEWLRHRRTQVDSASGLDRSYTAFRAKTGLGPDDLAGKRVLDVGVGSGRFAEIAASMGAAEVVGIDLTRAVDAAGENLGSRALIAQADLMRLPFPDGSFDVVFSIGVLHHTPDTRAAVEAIARLVKPGGVLAVWVYHPAPWHKSSDLYRRVTTRMSERSLYRLSGLASNVAALYRIPLAGKGFYMLLPVSSEHEREWRVLDTFDWYAPKYQWKHTVPEVVGWFRALGFEEVEPQAIRTSVRGRRPA